MKINRLFLFFLMEVIFISSIRKFKSYFSQKKLQINKLAESKKQAEYNTTLSKRISEGNKMTNEESNRLITWALSIIGGSILIIISTSYVRPTGYVLYSYFLFSIGWIFLGVSVYFGTMITRHYIANLYTDDKNIEKLIKIGELLNRKFNFQIKYFKYGVITFAIWLIVFLIWFVLFKK